MTATFSEVNPADTTMIWPVDAGGKRYREGASGFVLNVSGAPVGVLYDTSVPAFNLYLEDNQTASTPVPGGSNPDYYIRSDVRVFSGSLGDPAASVVWTYDWTRIPLADLYDVKAQEVADEDSRVRYNAVDTSLAANWWVVLTQRARSELLTIATGSNSRQIDGSPWPGGANQPRVGIYNAANERTRREAVPNQSTWDTIETEWYQHDQATGNATKASGDALEALNADAEAALAAAGGDVSDPTYQAAWNAVAAHDAADPAWNYPPTVGFSQFARALFGA